MLSLPVIHGTYPVGVTSFAAPLHPRPIGALRLQHPRTGKVDPALWLEEVAFTAYYPADNPPKHTKGVDWFPRPLYEALQGFATYLGISKWLLWPVVYLFGAFIKIPAYRDAPLLNPPKSFHIADKSADQWPLVLFSHGLGGSSTAYSQFCSRLAASGKVVLAIEHRDGSGMYCQPRPGSVKGNRTSQSLHYLRNSDIAWDHSDIEQDNQPLPLRAEQLIYRHHEIYLAYSIFSRFLRKDTSVELTKLDGSSVDRSWLSDTTSGEPIIRFKSNVTFAGHSFGGCTVLSILSTKPMEDYQPIPIGHAILLDPWLEPLPSPGPIPLNSTPSNNSKSAPDVESLAESLRKGETEYTTGKKLASASASPSVPMLVLNSETFTIWKDHFERLENTVRLWEPNGHKIVTLIGSEHISFSDFPVLPLVAKAGAHMLMDTICLLASSFLDDKLDKTLDDCRSRQRKLEIEIVGMKKDGKPKRKLLGSKGDIIIH